MTTSVTGGLAASDLWDISTSWSCSALGVLDTGGGLVTLVIHEIPPELPDGPELERATIQSPLSQRMVEDKFFLKLTEQGLADLDAKRFGPL